MKKPMEHKVKEITAMLGRIYELGLFRYVDVAGTVADVRAEVRAEEDEPKYRRRRKYRDLQGLGRYNPWK